MGGSDYRVMKIPIRLGKLLMVVSGSVHAPYSCTQAHEVLLRAILSS